MFYFPWFLFKLTCLVVICVMNEMKIYTLYTINTVENSFIKYVTLVYFIKVLAGKTSKQRNGKIL